MKFYSFCYLLLDKASKASIKEDGDRKRVARGKLIGAGMAVRAAQSHAIKNSRTCSVM